MKKKFSIIIFTVILALLVAGCQNSESTKGFANEKEKSGETRKIKVASILGTDHSYTKEIVPMWKEKIESKVDNVEIEWIGGPEAVPPENLFGAAQSGVVDVAFFFGSDSRDLVPAGESLRLSPLTPAEEREVGYYDYLAGEYDKAGVTYLGRWLSGFGYYFWTNNEVNSVADFKGLKLRSNPFYLDIINKLGATPVNTLTGEVYTALERNMVSGFAFPLLGPREDGWTEVTKFLVDEEFAEQSAVILMNPNTFAKFTEEEQAIIKEATAEFEISMRDYFDNKNSEEMKEVQKAGVQLVKLPTEESEKFQKLVNDVIWKQLEIFVSKEQFEKVKEFLVK